MNHAEILRDEALDCGVATVDWDFGETKIKGLYCDGFIAVSRHLENCAEESVILAEELGHHFTAGDVILDQSVAANRKQELRGRIWSYNRLVGLCGIIRAYKNGCRNRYEVAEFLEVPEDFLADAVSYYHGKFGVCTVVDNYTIYFEPLGVLESV